MRHGPTHVKRFVGWTDVPADLSDTAALARIHANLPHVPVISSTLDRAVKTADAIQNMRQRLPHDPRLRETYFGTWENLTWDEIQERDATLTRAVFETPGDTSPPEGESWNGFRARVYDGLDALSGDTIVVAHMGVIMAALHRAFGSSAYDALSHKIDPLSITQISHTSGTGWTVHSINKIL
jgi:broad specificity phosphatase PhoE